MPLDQPDFFHAQQRLERSTRTFLGWYCMIVVTLGLVMGLVAMGLVRYAEWSKYGFQPDRRTYEVAGAVGLAFGLALILINTQRALRRLRREIADLPQLLGGVEVHATAKHPAARRLFHVAEEMALAAQLPMPRIFVLAHEPSINACAIGWDRSSSALCLTLGCLYRLEREPLQAVVAHGFTEIAHRDPWRRLRILALIRGLKDTSAAGTFLLLPHSYKGADERINPFLLPIYPLGAAFGLALVIAGSLGFLLGEALQAATIRKRIRLGDAAAIAFTRDPLALAGALKQVGAFVLGSRLLTEHAGRFQPLFICQTEARYLDLFDAHPPLARRIRSLDPGWDGLYPRSHIVSGIAQQVQRV
jgi:Zn-dependent protease with chaperone function